MKLLGTLRDDTKPRASRREGLSRPEGGRLRSGREQCGRLPGIDPGLAVARVGKEQHAVRLKLCGRAL